MPADKARSNVARGRRDARPPGQPLQGSTGLVDLRPIAFVLGRILVLLAAMMLVPTLVDMLDEAPDSDAFLQSALITSFVGILLSLATSNALKQGLDARQAYLLTFAIWVIVPMFGALPFYFGPPFLGLTDAYFEAVSGITTTGASVIVGLDDLPAGINLWRGILNWLGGLGIAVVAMIFLPVMRVGGMQFFRTEAFDTMGKLMPRVADIAWSLVVVYVGLSVLAIMTYRVLGMTGLDAAVMGMASLSTGGFAPTDVSFGKYPGAAEYAGVIFMILGSLPFILYVQMTSGQIRPIFRDPQVRAFLVWLGLAVVLVTIWRLDTSRMELEPAFRETLFNLTSIMTGTGFFSGTFPTWEGFAMVVAFVVGMIGGCTGSSSGAISVFRVQLAGRALANQIRLIQSPHRVDPIRYAGRTVENDVIDTLMLFISGYILTIGVLSVAMTLTGMDMTSSLMATWTSLGNIGYAYGPMVAATGTFDSLPETAKWLMILAMILGRLGLLTLLVLVLPRFWLR
ncbi:MAG: TrkH family potassium uptake protein [Rhodobacterales bacterium]|nr:TrkH family potassium uptake protein [Rhodobacterales bacterium]